MTVASEMGASLPGKRLSVFYFLYFAVAGAALPYLPVLLVARGFDAAAIGTMLAIGMATKIIAPNLWAWWADRLGTRMSIIRFGIVAGGCAFAALEYVPSTLAWVAMALAFYNFFWNSVLPQFEVVTLNHLRARESRYSALRLWGSVGFVIAVLAAGWLTQEFGIGLLVPMITVLFACLAVASFVVPEPAAAGESSAHERDDERLWATLRTPSVLAFLVAVTLMQASHGPYYAFFTIQVEDMGYARTQVSLLWVLGVIAEVVLFACAPRLFARFSLRTLLLATAALTAIRWVMMAYAADVLVVLLVAQCLHAISFGLYHAAAIQVIRRRFTGTIAGRGQALFSSIGYGVGSALGSFVAGMLWADHGPNGAYLAAAGASALATGVLWIWMRESDSQANSDSPTKL